MPLARTLKVVTATAALVIVASSSVANVAQPKLNKNTNLSPLTSLFWQAQMIEDVGGTDRINYSGKLRMLSQRIPAAACNLQAGVLPQKSAKILAATSAEFNKIINALEYGDPSLNIKGTESRRKTLAAIKDVKAEWEPFGAAANMIIDEGVTSSLSEQLIEQSGGLLSAAKILVSELSGQYSDPAAIIQSDAIRIDIAGRQRMLSQKISKDLCSVLSGVNVDAAMESLGKTIATFDVSLMALRDGMPSAGIKASTNAEIVAGLDLVAQHWVKLQPHFEAVKATGSLDPELRASVFEQLNVLLVDMNKVVGMYAKVGKQQI